LVQDLQADKVCCNAMSLAQRAPPRKALSGFRRNHCVLFPTTRKCRRQSHLNRYDFMTGGMRGVSPQVLRKIAPSTKSAPQPQPESPRAAAGYTRKHAHEASWTIKCRVKKRHQTNEEKEEWRE
jgi:hypothetical protein